LVNEAARSDANLTWLGHLPRSDTLRVIGEADLLVFCAESYEGQPRVVVEAFARGTPVIAPRLGAMAGMVDEGVTGRFFSAGDAESLAETILALLAERGSLAGMRVAARRAFEESSEPTKATTALVDIYRAAIGASGDNGSKIPRAR
jgi:glycosyltransferase involved in cell wall biosynthesis